MSTLKVDAIRHNSATSDAITTVSDGTCTAKLTSIAGGGLSHRNMIVNGGMIVSQRGTDPKTIDNSGKNYQVDMYRGRAQGGGQFSIQQVIDAPSGTGLYNSLKMQVTTADTSIGNAEYYELIQFVEGSSLLPAEYGGSGAKTCTLSFYVKSNIANTFTGAIGNEGNNRGFGFNYTINSANTWERKTITIPGDTTGTWNKSNGVGAKIIFSLGIGANFATANVSTWETRETMGTDDGYSLIGSTSNNLYITGIQFEVGNIATTFEHRSIGDELLRCKRYYYQEYRNGSTGGNGAGIFALGMTTNSSSGSIFAQMNHPVEMRDAPLVTFSGTFAAHRFGVSIAQITSSNMSYNAYHNSTTATTISGTNSGTTPGQGTLAFLEGVPGTIMFSAEY